MYPFCDFFLWREQAKAREGGLGAQTDNAVEPPQPKTPSFTQRPLTAYGVHVTPGRRSNDDEDSGVAAADSMAVELSDSDEEMAAPSAPISKEMGTPCPGSSKRKRDVFEEEDEFSDLDSDEERQMAVITDKSAEKATAYKSVPVPPSNTRTHDVVGGLPTPSVARTLFPGSEAKRRKQVSFDDTASSATLSAPTTPNISRPQPPTSSPPDTSYDVTDEIMTLLRGQELDSEVLTAVKSVLATSARRTKGIALGRESARANLKAKDEKIIKLQERIAALENREKVHQSQMTNIKASLMQMYEEN